MKISVIHPSRGRSQMAATTAVLWLRNCNERIFEYIISVDSDDPQLADYERIFHVMPPNMTKIKCVVSNNKNVVDAMNAGAKEAQGDVLVCISDDFRCQKDWDKYILSHIDEASEQALKVNDGITKEDNCILTLPILTRKLYDRLGYVYHLEYSGIYADNDLAEACRAIGAFKVDHSLLFEHIHWSAGKGVIDETNKRHDNPKGWKLGEKLIKKRRKNNFGFVKEILLTVLLPTIPSREKEFIRLSNYLVSLAEKQMLSHLIEFHYDPRGKEIDIATKRQELLEGATGKYVTSIDDDDTVPEYYFSEIIEAIKNNPDCIGFPILCTFDGKNPQIALASNRFSKWADVNYKFNGSENYSVRYERAPFWCTPIKRELALKAGYTKGMRWNEDEDFSKRVKPFLFTEVFIHRIMYNYQHSSKENHKEKYGL